MNAFLVLIIASNPVFQGVRVQMRKVRPHSVADTFEDHCKEQGATIFGSSCTCDKSDAVCQKGETVGCGADNAEKKKFSISEWQSGPEPKCVPDTCAEKQATMTYDKGNGRWFCECKNPNAHCFSGGTHCPFESGLQFPKQFTTSCSSCLCKISPSKKFWSTDREEYEALCSKGDGIFDAKDSQAFGQLTCNCAKGMHIVSDGESTDSFSPSTCPECKCISRDGDSSHDETSGVDASEEQIKKANPADDETIGKVQNVSDSTHDETLDAGASEAQIKKANPADDEAIKKVQNVNQASQVLSDVASKESYDKCRACGLLVAPEEDGRVMQYEITAPEESDGKTSYLIRIYKTRPDAEISDGTLRSGEDAVELVCSEMDLSAFVEIFASRGDHDKSTLLCTGAFEYKRSRHGIWVHFGEQTAQMTLQLIATGTKEEPIIYVKETRDSDDQGVWNRVYERK